jgi:glycosyltransferase involved in cell wall biosynthesis
MNIKISVIIPIRNEEAHIEKTLESIVNNNLIDEAIEILIIDGLSNDNTCAIVVSFISKHPDINLKLLINEDRTVPYAMNLGIKESKGDIIIRMDSHSIFPKNYINKIISSLKKYDADNVGGIILTKPHDNSLKSKAISIVSSHIFGVGNSYFRIGSNAKIKYVDTVPFGCYKREVFDIIGLYDTELTRNQDDELNARLLNTGGKIVLIPSIKIKYFARESFKKLFDMFYQYAYFKPLVNKKVKAPTSIRQFVPLFFVLFLFSFPLTLLNNSYENLFIIVICFYMLISFSLSLLVSRKHKDYGLLLYLIYGFFIIQFSYGYGYIKGILNFYILNKTNKIKTINLSR